MKFAKKLLAVVLASLLLLPLGALSFAEDAPEVLADGICGANEDGGNVKWIFSSDGTLTLRGAGETRSYADGETERPWSDYIGMINALQVDDGVTGLGTNLLKGLSHLKTISLPATLEAFSLGLYDYASFGNNLTSVTVDPANPNMSSADGVLTSTDGTALLAYPVGRHFVAIPEGVTSFTGFYGCTNIVSVTIPEGVQDIPSAAFAGCVNLVKIALPLSMREIAEDAFTGASLVQITAYPGTQEQFDDIVLSGNDNPVANNLVVAGFDAYSQGKDAVFDERTVTEASCTEPGAKELMYRITPGDTWNRFNNGEGLVTVLGPLGHAPGAAVSENMISATCTTGGGYDTVTYCSRCADELSRTHVTLNATGHSWGEWEVITEATYESEGLMRRVCQNDASHVEERVIPRYEEDPNGEPSNVIQEFIEKIESYTRGIIDWILRLFNFFGH